MAEAEQPGNTKVTREDWISAALETLISDGIEQVKVLSLAKKMHVSRSSFYWYFKDRRDLLNVLLDHWMNTNTQAIIDACDQPAPTITQAICNVFVGFVDPDRFHTQLDFAIRDWARRDPDVRTDLDRSDSKRIGALKDLFVRFGYPERESLARARVVYYMQIGYNDADLDEPMADRLILVPEYLFTYTGHHPAEGEVEAFRALTLKLECAEKVADE